MVDPRAVGAIDLMVGFPSANAHANYDYLRAQMKDAGSATMAFPAEYMFTEVPNHVDEGEDPVATKKKMASKPSAAHCARLR